ncbi:MAG: hypothetical protein RLP09_37440 [Sandaracinaceae bacterium]
MSLRAAILTIALALPASVVAQTHGPEQVAASAHEAWTASGTLATQIVIEGAGADLMVRVGAPHPTSWNCYSSSTTYTVTCEQWYDRSDGRIIDTAADPIVTARVVLSDPGTAFVVCSALGACVITVGSSDFARTRAPMSEWDGVHPPASGPVGFNLWSVCEGYTDERGPEHHPEGRVWTRCAITGMTNTLPLPDGSIDSMAHLP